MSAASHIPSLPTDLAAQDFWAEAEALGRALVNQLEYLEALGVTEWPRSLLPPPPPPTPALPPPPRPTRPAAVSGRRPAAPDPAPFPRDGGDLPAWRLQLAACQACTLAQGGGEAPAAGRGAEKPLLVVVGPDPSIHGGATGELLINMVEKGLSLTPDEYYLTALVKCRPPEGTEPSPEAVAACRPILQRAL